MTFDLEALGAGLPMAAALGELDEALASGCVVLQAPPGTGKTTIVPPAVANHVSGRVVVTQPRRVAARAAAARLATLSGTRLGEEVGYVVRGERRVSRGTTVEVCTHGVLLRRLLADVELEGVDAVVVDEVHERSIESDLVLAMVAELRELRPELLLVVMSATLDAERWSALLGGAPVVAAAAERHPLEVRWAPAPGSRTDARGVTPAFLDHVARQAADVATSRPGTVLAFVPGARECDEVVARLARLGVAADALHGSLDSRTQDRVLAGTSEARVIVATSVAESSLTVPGVRTVVDSGLAREPRLDQARGMTGLVTVAEARSSAEQRAGRAARVGPGVVVRCFPERDWAGLRPFATPEILTADLTQAALDLAVWGAPGGVGLALPDAPPAAALAAAHHALRALGAVEVVPTSGAAGAAAAGGVPAVRATELGRRLARLPVDPRLGRALLVCAPEAGPRAAAEVVALLAGDERIDGGDVAAAWRRARTSGNGPWRREAERLERLVRQALAEQGGAGRGQGTKGRTDSSPTHSAADGQGARDDDAVAALVVASAHPEWLARRRPGASEYLLASGTGAELPRDSRLHGAPWLAVAEVARTGERALVRAAAPIDEASAVAAAGPLLVEETVATFADGRVTARRVRRLGAIELAATPVAPTADDGRAAVRDALQRRGLVDVLGWGEDVEALRRRLALLHRELGEPWPAVDDASLAARADEWLGPELDALAHGRRASSLDLVSALRRLLPWPQAGRLDELAPERLEVPTGSRLPLQYPADGDGRVVLAVKLQECFGLVDTPRIVDGRVPVLLHLLSPAQRPLAVTDDLASFWVNAYPSVRAENRGRYAKHPWPEDPLTAPPRRGTTRSGR